MTLGVTKWRTMSTINNIYADKLLSTFILLQVKTVIENKKNI